MPLLAGSPAIDAGSNPSALTTDQRGTGFGRVVGTAADIGSFEIQPACAGLSFAPAVIYAVGNAPRSVATADFNGDGKTDLAVANRDSDNISILTGNGDGTFEPAVNYAVGDSPYPVTTADFNGDGKADLATANYASGNISVLTGNGDGTFAPAVNFAAGNPIFVVTGDFNGDGKTDLAAAINTNDILVLTGNGDGTFAPAGSFAVGASGPLSITTGDFNGDSKTDLASANRFSNNISVLTGNGDGTFAPAVNLAAGNEPLSVTTGDFNGDGKTDLVASNAISNTLVALFGNGDGTFASAVNFAEGGLWITTGDFNGDGKTDIALANGSNSMPVFTGNGDGTFSPRVTFAVGNSPLFVTTGDFNGDGKTDLAASGPGSNNISVLLNGCTSNTAPVANDDSYSVDEDGSLGEAAPGVLGDDTDNENDSLTATLATGPLHAQSFTLNADGSFSYTPQPNYNGPDSFTYGANDGSLDSNIATVAITVNAVADTPSVTNAATSEDVQSTSGLVISRNATDGSEVTHFKITNIANGTLFLNNGTTPINNGTFITFAQANAGLKFSPAANFFGAASFDVQASVSPSDLGLGGVVVTATITVNAVPDTPSVTNASTNEDVQTSSGLVISRNAVDSAEVTFFKVTGITNGTMFLNDGASPVFNGNFISVAQGNAGLKFTPNANFSGAGSFQLQAALIDHTLGGGIVTATITVNAVNDAPLVSATPETQPAVQYSDAIQPVTINASDLETPVGSLSIGFSYVRNAEPSVAGLPAGMSQGGVAGAWTVSGTAGVPAGTYVITARVTDTGDGSSPAMTSSDTFTIVVTRENAVAAPRLSNPVAMQVASAGGSASGVTGQICFDITEPSDGSAGNTALINAATVQLSAVGGGSAGSITPSAVTFSGGGVGGTRTACFTLTLAWHVSECLRGNSEHRRRLLHRIRHDGVSRFRSERRICIGRWMDHQSEHRLSRELRRECEVPEERQCTGFDLVHRASS
jgi:hypothetical protein